MVMADEKPSATEAAAEIFHRVLQEEPDIQHAFQVLVTLVVCALDGNTPEAKAHFLKVLSMTLARATFGRDHIPHPDYPKPDIEPATPMEHDMYVYLAGWNPGETKPN
jgi:hypothetical protein